MKLEKYKKIILFLFSFLLFFSIKQVKGAILYIEPRTATYSPGSVFMAAVKIDTEGECLNVIEADIGFDNNKLQLVDFSIGDSFLAYWVKLPQKEDLERINKEGSINFAGGIPGGYCGAIPGDPGKSNVVVKLIFSVPGMTVSSSQKNGAYIKPLSTSQAYLNTAFGERANLRFQEGEIKISDSQKIPKNLWQEELKKDKIPPETFAIYIQRKNDINQGKYFIVFNTTDKQSGLDHYEIKEYDKNGFIPGTKQKAEWKIAKSPYVLEDQKLRSTVLVKAVDKAWNERIVKFVPSEHINIPEKEGIFFAKLGLTVKISLAVFIILVLVILFLKIRKKKNK